MDDPFMFTGAAYPFVEDMAYHNTPFGHTEEGLMGVPMSYIDPSLQSPSPSAPYLSKWNPPQLVQRYLEDTQKTAFFNADVPSHMSASRGHMRPTVGIPPVPPPSQSARYTSPISSVEHSSSESSALSPPADTESHFDSNFPSTPPDTTLLSPYQHHSGFEHWNAPAHAIQFMSMGPTESFVNPIDVNPSQQLEYCENESAVNDFSLSSRGYSFESCNSAASQCDREPVNNQIILDVRTKRMASPDELAPAARGSSSASNPTPSSTPNLPNGSIFNRKDLYTQHLRRMHTPPNIKKKQAAAKKSGGSSAAPSANVGNAGSASSNPSMLEWEDHLRNLQQRAIQERCKLPINMQCPARDCTQAFQGTDAWDQRMEHVAKHLEKAAVGKEDSVVFGGDNDPTLVQWASRPDVGIIKPAPAGRAGAWELNTPIRRGPGGATLVVAAAPVVITPTPMPATLLPVQPATAGNAALHSDDEEEGEEEIVVTGEEMDEDDNEEEEEDDDDLRDGEGEEDDDGC
ncbi:hypothetical protein B0T26DRAFT_638447 [Lasiosphaeria miniovina]|uniref:C2H2-type domain-containing protein n=1 Tax=Lasiosphaeria miniovina TaxID=1954250 RepID=A0AA40E6A7_9PEZI|nr:uncharacterized protein B0T26DRAFT_638447 [Lasiosphaeria miniovina]KAK0728600.1 hypothetical protein B0T26DRAFT_638447 [Lasiosphaeria miniovina]